MWRFSRRIPAPSKFIHRKKIQQNETFVRRFSREPEFEEQNNDLFKASQFNNAISAKTSNNFMLKEIDEYSILKVTSQFFQKHRKLYHNQGIDETMLDYLYYNFLEYCFETDSKSVALHNKLNDIINGAAHSDDLSPFFLSHANGLFPNKSCIKRLQQIYHSKQITKKSDLTNPPSWFPRARSQIRRIIFHAGPTNSGKTYRAMQRFLEAKTGIYCGPLRLLAVEVFQKSNKMGTPCDLLTGEERRYGNPDKSEANHIAVTTEMSPLNRKFDVAIIDEIQLLKESERGGSWTRALLGLNADEIHVCGEAGTRELLERLCLTTGETVEYHHYDRLTQLTVEDKAIESLDKLEPGDCIVCFNKNDIYSVSRDIELLGKEVAVIYGSLPPNTKLAQAAKFNDPNNPCKIMVATDAIGMGLNLSIRRIIFYAMGKLGSGDDGKSQFNPLSVSQTLQIAGRAGRFGTQWEQGYVTTYKQKDLRKLKKLLVQKPEPITQAGLRPTIEQIEFYADQLPKSSLSSVMDIFTSISTLNDDLYFMCNMNDFKILADIIQHIKLPFRVRYVYCFAPINPTKFVREMFTKFVNLHSQCMPITWDFVAENCELPATIPQSTDDLTRLENTFEVLHLYLWLSKRFADIYPDGDRIRLAQEQLENTLQKGVAQKGFWN